MGHKPALLPMRRSLVPVMPPVGCRRPGRTRKSSPSAIRTRGIFHATRRERIAPRSLLPRRHCIGPPFAGAAEAQVCCERTPRSAFDWTEPCARQAEARSGTVVARKRELDTGRQGRVPPAGDWSWMSDIARHCQEQAFSALTRRKQNAARMRYRAPGYSAESLTGGQL
jgi:hypothetical protein